MLEKITCLNVTFHLKYFIIGLLNGTAIINNLPSSFKLLVSQAYNFFKSHPRIFNLTASSEKNTHAETHTLPFSSLKRHTVLDNVKNSIIFIVRALVEQHKTVPTFLPND